MKPSITTLRLDGHVVAIYTDDLTNVGLVFWWMCEKCHNINKAFEIEAFKHIGVYSSRQIYIFLTEQKIKFLAFNINSKKKGNNPCWHKKANFESLLIGKDRLILVKC